MNEEIPPEVDGHLAPSPLQPYDFRKPHRAVVDRDRILDSLHADFAASLASEFSSQLDKAVAIAPIAVESMRYDDLCRLMSQPTLIGVLRIEPLRAQACLNVPLDVMFPMIDALLGGRGTSIGPAPERALTQIELRFAVQIIERAAAQLADSFSRHVPPGATSMTVREDGVGVDPAEIRLMPGDEVLTVMRFEVNIATQHATMRLGLPTPVIDVLCDLPMSASTSFAPPDRERDTQNLTQNIMQSAVELRALLGEVRIRRSDILSMQDGDIITTDIPADSSIPLRLNDQTIRFVRPAQLHGRRAVQITDRRPDDVSPGEHSS